MSDEDETFYPSDPPQTRLACSPATIHTSSAWAEDIAADWTAGSIGNGGNVDVNVISSRHQILSRVCLWHQAARIQLNSNYGPFETTGRGVSLNTTMEKRDKFQQN